MLEVLEYIFSSPYKFFGVLTIITIICHWNPINITYNHTHHNDYRKEDNDE